MTRSVRLALLTLALAASGCGGAGEDALFERLDASESGVTFENTLAEGLDFNIISYLYYYNGGGVAAGDVNGDALPDLYFTANEGPNALYLNRTEAGGPVRFEEVTEVAGVAGTSDWTTGVAMADVDGDGRLDIYVSALGAYKGQRGRNELFLNEGPDGDGVPRFREAAAEVGLDFEGFGTQAAFFDYDRDGDLDVYLLNHAVHTDRTYKPPRLTRLPDARSGDRLYRNDSDEAGTRFTDVTEAAGITSGISGYGLSVVTSDLDGDGWPDVYVGNDFHENDFVYLNNGDGTFRETFQTSLRHSSRFSMGADAADIDNDGDPDLVVLDMMPRDETIRVTSAGDDTYEIDSFKRYLGYGPQVARNSLQINRGVGPDGTPRFSDVATLAGMEATDWSWAALLADLDLDGSRDLFVTNGIWRRPNDLDYINYVSDAAIQRELAQGLSEENAQIWERMPQVAVPNEAFRGTDSLAFVEAPEWGLGEPGHSNGAATVDLDNDGDLDLVVNNVNAPASVYLNRAAERGATSLAMTLEGDGPNTSGLGARVEVWTGDTRQTAEAFGTRGFLSSVDPRLVVGLDGAERADRVRVTWPDGRVQTLTDVPAGPLTLRQTEAGPASEAPTEANAPLFFTADAAAPDWTHVENTFLDFNRERLMPHVVSREGPALAVGDIDGDGRDDLFVGGARRQASALFRQTASGALVEAAVPVFADSVEAEAEAVDAVFFDADADGDLDLYVATAGNEFRGERDPIRDRLYLGDGAGGFERADADALPRLFVHTGTVAAGDWDGDGDTDLFVGGRVVPRAYGMPAQSALLENDGTGRFRDVTEAVAPGLADVGMVAASAWGDLDGDGRLDLALTGEWMAPTVFLNTGSGLERTEAGMTEATGWWTALDLADLDGDGDLDLALGNLGLNSRIRATAEHPARLWLADFDDNDALDGILTSFRDDDEYPLAPVLVLQQTFPELRQRFPTYTEFGARTVPDLFGDRARSAEQRTATTFASVVALNDGTGTFRLRPLPRLAQVEPTYAIRAGDIDGDGATDLVLGGGLLGVRPNRGRYDAGHGLVLLGDGRGGFTPAEPGRGLALDGEVRALRWLDGPGGRRLVAGVSDGPLRVLRLGGERGAETVASR